MNHGRPVSVAVLVDLERGLRAGGHVKCWERLAEAALQHPKALDLTVFVSGEAERTTPLGTNVRFVAMPPVFSTRRLEALTGPLPDHTDLSPWHPRLARRLTEGGFDVVHTTDAYFAFAKTAERLAARTGLKLVNSIHTNTPALTRLFTGQTITTLCGHGWLERLLSGSLDLPGRLERAKLARLAAHQARCAYALVSRPDDARRAAGVLPSGRVRMLRRGIDQRLFGANRRDRAWLETRFGVSQSVPVALFVGRLDPSKNLDPLIEAVRLVNERGTGLHLFCAGDGRKRAEITQRLGALATCPGQVDADDLAKVYASADMLAMPSEIEVLCNVVLEGLASGLPAIVAEAGGMGGFIQPGLTGEVVRDGGAPAWAEALEGLAANPDRLVAMRDAVAATAPQVLPRWDDVLTEDLLPVWRAAAEPSC